MKSISEYFIMYWAFYKSTIILNNSVSFAIAFLGMVYGGNFFNVFAGSFISIGPLAAFLYKELSCPLEYYFYYNQGISKNKLIIFCLLVNILSSALILMIAHYVASA